MESNDARVVCRGDEALALGAQAAGVTWVSGYPGSPATGVFEALARLTHPEEVSLEWAANEKIAVELAIGASLAGARALVVLKSVGLNIALDPLATASYAGCHAGLVILLGDDPGGWSSQNEQDSRWLARVAEVPLVEATDVTSAACLMVQAYTWSESLGMPVIVRLTRAMANATALVETPWQLPPAPGFFAEKEGRWLVYPQNVVRRHHSLHHRLLRFQQALAASPYDRTDGSGDLGILAAGFLWSRLRALGEPGPGVSLRGSASAWPLPEPALALWLRGLGRVLVLEEGGPFVEEQVRDIVQRAGLAVDIRGRATRDVPQEGELADSDLLAALQALRLGSTGRAVAVSSSPVPPTVPLCADCPYRFTFDALGEAMDRNGGRSRFHIVGETGCMVRAIDSGLFDVKYSLGSSLGIAIGLASSDAQTRVVALVGDSCFFHSEMNALGLLGARQSNVAAIVLDNGSTALTGGQGHPGSAYDARHSSRPPAGIAEIVRAHGLPCAEAYASEAAGLAAALDGALSARTPAVLVIHGPCPRFAGEEAPRP